MPSTSMLKARGLHTFNNYLSAIPEGALIKAENVVIDREGVVEPRRGIKQYGTIGTTSADVAKQLILYKDRILAHFSSTIAYDDGSGTFTNFSGASFLETESGLRIKYVEVNGNLYLTTSTGIRKIAATSAATLSSANITDAGGIKASTGIGKCNFSTAGFFLGYSKVSYRITWGTKDVNGNLIEGFPSPIIEVINQSPNSCTVDLTFEVPNGINTNYFYRVYRTNIVEAGSFSNIDNVSTGDEMKLVIEDAYVSGTQITLNDATPEDFRNSGLPLYTNEFSGEGILQGNEAPPFAKDIATYKNIVFYANTRTKHKLLINLLGVGDMQSFGGINDSINITSISYSAPDTTITFSAAPGLVVGQKIVIKDSGAATLDGIRTVATVLGNDITVVADGTGATAADCSIYGSSITIQKGVSSYSYYFVGRPEIYDITFDSFASTTDGGYFLINSASDENKYFIWFDKTGTTLEPSGVDTNGRIGIRVAILAGDTDADVAAKVKAAVEANSFDFIIDQSLAVLRFTSSTSGAATNPALGIVPPGGVFSILVMQNGHGEETSNRYVKLSTASSPSQKIDETARSLVKVINNNTSEVVNAYYIFSPNDLPGKMQLESKTLDTQAFTVVANSSDVGALFNPNISTAVSSENEEKANRLYYSKVSQPEAVPLVNYIDIGPQDKRILRILGLRDSLFIMKEEGIYRLAGENSSNFFVTLFDNSAIVIAPDTAVILNNQIYVLTSQGVATISETGVSIISRPIENVFNRISSPLFVNYSTASFACSYEADRAYLIFVPKDAEDTVAQECYRFNTFTQTWTSWVKEAKCALVNPVISVNKLFIGPNDINIVEIERKNLNREDYADRQFSIAINPDAINNTTIQLSSIANVEVGDVLVQTQYVTLAQVIRLAKKFALDPGVPNTVGNSNKDYYRNFSILAGDKLQDKMTELITQLNSDISSAYSVAFSLSFSVFQTEYNNLINAFNLDATLLHTNYLLSTGTVDYEVSVVAVDKGENTVDVIYMEPLLEGPIIHYKAIKSEVIYAPFYFGEPSLMKHVREATIMFEDAGIAFAQVGYNSDLSTNFEDINFNMEGAGDWGAFFYSATTWGGEGTARPFRTLIPRQKQRCRFLRTRFKNRYAFYKYAVLGISYAFEVNSERAYK